MLAGLVKSSKRCIRFCEIELRVKNQLFWCAMAPQHSQFGLSHGKLGLVVICGA